MKKTTPATALAAAAIAATAALAGTPAMAQADAFPSKPIRMIVVYPPGGGADVLSRTLGEAIAKRAGQPLIVENRAGANGMIGMSACKNAVPDGYTYCIGISDVATVNPYIYAKVPYDVDRDFVPVASIATVVGVFAVHADVPGNTLKEFAERTRAAPGKVNWGTWGIGSAAHLVMAQLNRSLGAELTHVPYQGVPQIVNALVGKEVDGTMLFYGPMAGYIQNGRLKPLAVLSEKRLPQLPNVPTAEEQGLNFATTLWYGVFAPTGTPAAHVGKFNTLLNAALADPAVVKTLDAQGLVPLPDTPDGFKQRIARDRVVWGQVARSLKLSLD